MRIGLFLDQWRDGGVPVFLEKLERQLTEKGHHVVLILADPFPKREDLPKCLYQELHARMKGRCVSLNLSSYPKKWKRSHFRKAILAKRFDCLLINQFYDHLTFLKDVGRDVPLVSVSHTDSDHYYHEFLHTLDDHVAHVAVSKEIERKCLAFSAPEDAHKIHYIPYGVESDTSFDPVPSGVMRVVYSARLDPLQKRCRDLVPIWNEYRRRGGTGELTILGSGRGMASLELGLRDEIANGGVILKGHLRLPEAQNVMAHGDVLMNVSNFEGLPQVVLEGASLGLFPLLSDIPSGHREIVETLGTGALIHLGDHESFAAELMRLERNLSLIRSQRASIREKALRHYSLPDCGEKYLRVLELAARAKGVVPVPVPYKPSFIERIERVFLLAKYRRHFRPDGGGMSASTKS